MWKRYQIITRGGVAWSRWFTTSGTPTRWQLKGKLLNEYRESKPPDDPTEDPERHSQK